jgi:hypothetical protein
MTRYMSTPFDFSRVAEKVERVNTPSGLQEHQQNRIFVIRTEPKWSPIVGADQSVQTTQRLQRSAVSVVSSGRLAFGRSALISDLQREPFLHP